MLTFSGNIIAYAFLALVGLALLVFAGFAIVTLARMEKRSLARFERDLDNHYFITDPAAVRWLREQAIKDGLRGQRAREALDKDPYAVGVMRLLAQQEGAY